MTLVSLDALQHAAASYFLENVDPKTGLIFDSNTPQSDASIAATGFGLAVYTVLVEQGQLLRTVAVERTLKALRFLWNAEQSENELATGYKGFFYHFLTRNEGKRAGGCELSVIDTSLLLAGILTAAMFFDRQDAGEQEIRSLADQIYRRVIWPWAISKESAIAHGWKPETGFLNYDWKGYSEALILYILGLGSPTQQLPYKSYSAWQSTYQWENMYGHTFIYSGHLFVHQFSHIWVDFRGIQDDFLRKKKIDYFENSKRAVAVQQQYARENPLGFVGYGKHFWGITSLEGPGFDSYSARAVPYGPDDGTIAPWAVAASVPFDEDLTLKTLTSILHTYPETRKEDGMLRAINPTYGWTASTLFGIEQGPVALMLANHKSGLIWNLLKRCSYVREGLKRCHFSGGWLT